MTRKMRESIDRIVGMDESEDAPKPQTVYNVVKT